MFNSVAFRVLGSFFTVSEVVLWLGILTMTLYRTIQGEIFVAPCLLEAGGTPPKGGCFSLERRYEYEPRNPARAKKSAPVEKTSSTDDSSQS